MPATCSCTVSGEMKVISNAPEVDANNIPDYELTSLAKTMLKMMDAAMQDPAMQAKYKAWKAERAKSA